MMKGCKHVSPLKAFVCVECVSEKFNQAKAGVELAQAVLRDHSTGRSRWELLCTLARKVLNPGRED